MNKKTIPNQYDYKNNIVNILEKQQQNYLKIREIISETYSRKTVQIIANDKQKNSGKLTEKFEKKTRNRKRK